MTSGSVRSDTTARAVHEPSPSRPLTVLQSFPEPRPTTNPYVVLVRRSLEARPGLRVRTFDWRTALLGRYDVFHVHWPEILVGGRTRLRRAGRRVATTLLLLRLAVTRTPVVRTVHNVHPHETPARTAALLLAGIDRLTRAEILLTPSPTPRPHPTRLVPHGHYRDWYAGLPRSTAVPGRLVSAGLVRPYKQVDRLITAFAGVDDPAASLLVVGAPSGNALAEDLRRRADGDPRVSVRLEHVDDADFVAAVTSAQLVVLPYAELHNSGAALAALSLDRPVLVPDNAVTRDLADEVGARWVQRFTGTLDAADLQRALAATRDLAGRPDLDRRDWTTAGAAHEAAYRAALGRRAPTAAGATR